jgi:hypothetical protein
METRVDPWEVWRYTEDICCRAASERHSVSAWTAWLRKATLRLEKKHVVVLQNRLPLPKHWIGRRIVNVTRHDNSSTVAEKLANWLMADDQAQLKQLSFDMPF